MTTKELKSIKFPRLEDTAMEGNANFSDNINIGSNVKLVSFSTLKKGGKLCLI